MSQNASGGWWTQPPGGAAQPSGVPLPPSGDGHGEQHRRVAMWVGAALVVVAIVVGVVLVLTNGRTQPADSATTEPAQTSSVPTTGAGTTVDVTSTTTPPTISDPPPTAAPTSVPIATLPSLPGGQPVVVTCGALPTYLASEPVDAAIGMAAPVIDGFDFQGTPMEIDAARQGATLLVFVAHWCPHCNAELPRLIEWMADGGVPDGLRVVLVSTAVSVGSVNYPPGEWLADRGWTASVLVDEGDGDGAPGAAAQAFGASALPYFVVVGADGTVKARVTGERTIEGLAQFVRAALGL